MAWTAAVGLPDGLTKAERMMAAIPQMNLSPEATPWGRWAQQEILELRTDLNRAIQALESANRAQDAILAKLTQV